MQTRRGIIVVVSGILAGCGALTNGDNANEEGIQDSDDDGVIDSEDYAPNDPEVQEKSDIQSGDDPQTPMSADTSPETESFESPTATDTTTPTEAETPTKTETPSTAQLTDNAVESYRQGLEDKDTAESHWADGNSFFNEDDFVAAAEQYENAESAYINSKDHFRNAEETVSDIDGYQGAENIAQDSAKFADNAAKQAEAVKEACNVAAEKGKDSNEYENKMETFQELQADGEQYDVDSMEKFKTALEVD